MTAQVIISKPAGRTCRAISAETMKMPEPIMEPITIVVALKSPNAFANPVPCFVR